MNKPELIQVKLVLSCFLSSFALSSRNNLLVEREKMISRIDSTESAVELKVKMS